MLSTSVNITSLWQGGISGAVANIYLTDKIGFGKVSTALNLRKGHLNVNFNAVPDNCSGSDFTGDRIRDPIVRSSLPCLRVGVFHQRNRHVFTGMSPSVIYPCIYYL